MKFCFVILHYKTFEDTIECVESIHNLLHESQIVIVDNASNNGSIEKIEEKYKNNRDVFIVKNSDNIGFAAGNNIGYKFARNNLNADFIAISNNDIIVETNSFIKDICDYYLKNRFDILGPDIVSATDAGHQNPMSPKLLKKSDVSIEILRYRLLLFLSRTGIYNILKPNRKVHTGSVQKKIDMQEKRNVILHGSFVVFSPDFVREEEIAFREGTFLYAEEVILEKYSKAKGYEMVFYPFVKVTHKEDSATNSLGLSNKEKREFIFSNMINSLSIYKKYF